MSSFLFGIGEYGLPLFQQHHRKFVSLELCVEFLGQVDGMTRIGERYLLVLGSRILREHVAALEIDREVVEEHSPDAFRGQHLISLVGRLVGQFN